MRKILALFAILVLTLSVACSRRGGAVPNDSWSQGYEGTMSSGQSVYMQPDHGWFYYWFMFSLLNRAMTPTYHAYVPPAGYPATYRPWHPTPASVKPTYSTPAVSSPRTSGGFSNYVKPATTPTASPRSTGGFSPTYRAPSTSSSPRSSGGFSSGASRPSSSPRSSGGFGGRR